MMTDIQIGIIVFLYIFVVCALIVAVSLHMVFKRLRGIELLLRATKQDSKDTYKVNESDN